MRNCHSHFQMVCNSNDQTWLIYWKDTILGKTVPLPEKNSLRSNIWIIATGPSLADIDLNQLKGKVTLGVNGAINAYEAKELSPDYYAITDRDFFANRMDLVEKAVLSGAHCLFSFNGLALIAEKKPELLKAGKISLLETANRYYDLPQLCPPDWQDACSHSQDLYSSTSSKVGWSNDLNKGVFTANTITYIGCQIAHFLGTSNVFILGMDLNSGSRAARFYESGTSARPTTISKDFENEILPAFKLLTELNLTTKFWNLSQNSRLPESILKKISLEESILIDTASNQ